MRASFLPVATDDRPLLVVHLAAQQAQAARVVHLLRSPLELQAATISSELSPLGAATVAALCAEPTHTFQIPAGSVAAGSVTAGSVTAGSVTATADDGAPSTIIDGTDDVGRALWDEIRDGA